MKKLCSITIKGKENTWSFNTFIDIKYLNEYRNDGLEIDEIENIIPVWIVNMGLINLWCFFQDLWNGKFLKKFGW